MILECVKSIYEILKINANKRNDETIKFFRLSRTNEAVRDLVINCFFQGNVKQYKNIIEQIFPIQEGFSNETNIAGITAGEEAFNSGVSPDNAIKTASKTSIQVAYSTGKNLSETFLSAADSAGKVSAKISRKLKIPALVAANTSSIQFIKSIPSDILKISKQDEVLKGALYAAGLC